VAPSPRSLDVLSVCSLPALASARHHDSPTPGRQTRLTLMAAVPVEPARRPVAEILKTGRGLMLFSPINVEQSRNTTCHEEEEAFWPV
jgi:hypothetical protein